MKNIKNTTWSSDRPTADRCRWMVGLAKLHYPASEAAQAALSKGQEKRDALYFSGDPENHSLFLSGSTSRCRKLQYLGKRGV